MKEPWFLSMRPHFKGMPVPYTALWRKGTPDFKTLDEGRVDECVDLRLCGLCGQKLNDVIVFIGGPGSVGSKVFRDPAMHEACARYAFTVCPFLLGRDYSETGKAAVSTVSPERPSEMFLYLTTGYEALRMTGETLLVAKPAIRAEKVP